MHAHIRILLNRSIFPSILLSGYKRICVHTHTGQSIPGLAASPRRLRAPGGPGLHRGPSRPGRPNHRAPPRRGHGPVALRARRAAQPRRLRRRRRGAKRGEQGGVGGCHRHGERALRAAPGIHPPHDGRGPRGVGHTWGGYVLGRDAAGTAREAAARFGRCFVARRVGACRNATLRKTCGIAHDGEPPIPIRARVIHRDLS